MTASENGCEAAGNTHNEHPCHENAQHDGPDGTAQPHVDEGSDEGARPCPGTGKRNGHQQEQSEIFAAADFFPFALGAGFQFSHKPFQPLTAAAKPEKHLSYTENDEGHGDQIADDGGKKRLPRGEPERHTEGDRAPSRAACRSRS